MPPLDRIREVADRYRAADAAKQAAREELRRELLEGLADDIPLAVLCRAAGITMKLGRVLTRRPA
jgi:hypothetical protein